jgi:hypothetical protein
MKAILALMIGLSVYASTNLQNFCKDSIKSEGSMLQKDEVNFYKGKDRTFAYGRSHKIGNYLKVFKGESEETIPFDFKIMDMKEVGDKIYILQPQHFMVLNSSTLALEALHKTTHQFIEKKHQIAREFEIIGESVYIAHGSFGLVVLNKNTGLITKEAVFDLPHAKNHLSSATGIAVAKDRIYMAYDNVTYDFNTKKRAFEGLLILDHELNKLKAIPIKQNREALHEPSLSIIDGDLYSQNLEHIYVYSTKKIMRAKKFWPKKRLFRFFDGARLMSKPIIEKDKLKGCFSKYNPDTDSFSAFFREFIPKF